MDKTTRYRTVLLEVFQDEDSKAWFYAFGFHWVIYRANQGFKDYSLAREAGENHIDRLFKEHSVEI